MSDRGVEIEGRPDYGGPFRVGDELTIYEAGMVYSGRHPGGKFLGEGGTDYGRASIDEYESFLGRGAVDGPRKLGWDIRCEILNRIKARIIEPVRASFTANGEIDLRDTVIKTADVAALARKRNESPEYLARWMIVPPTDMPEGAPRPEAQPTAARKPRMSDTELNLKVPSFLKRLQDEWKLEGRRFNQQSARNAAEVHFGKTIDRSRFRVAYRNAGLNQDSGRPRKNPPKS